MPTKAQKRKERKRVARRRKLRKERNIRRNNRATLRFRLDVRVDGEWHVAKKWRSEQGVRQHLRETEEIRERGDMEIVEGRVIDLINGTEVHHIEPFELEAENGPTMREAVQEPKQDCNARSVDDTTRGNSISSDDGGIDF